jgi:hypothetical protein
VTSGARATYPVNHLRNVAISAAMCTASPDRDVLTVDVDFSPSVGLAELPPIRRRHFAGLIVPAFDLCPAEVGLMPRSRADVVASIRRNCTDLSAIRSMRFFPSHGPTNLTRFLVEPGTVDPDTGKMYARARGFIYIF